MKPFGLARAALLTAALTLFACSDETSPAGSQGTAGPSGPGSTSGSGGASTGQGGTGAAGGGTTSQGGSGGAPAGSGGSGGAVPFALTSEVVMEGAELPPKYSCKGQNVSPPLAWVGAPAGTKSYAIVFRDLSNGLGHSAIFDIPANVSSLPENVEKVANPSTPAGAKQCKSYAGQNGYAGPCPGQKHTYEFTLYAVSQPTLPGVTTDSKVDAVDTAAKAIALDDAKLTVTFTP
jgi:Raf kinase inhibitor-like YbhB/YbcL family protein